MIVCAVVFLRVHQHACAVLQHLLHVLSDWSGHVAGLLPAPLLQGQEADWVKTCPNNQGPRTSSWHQNLRPLTFALPRRFIPLAAGGLKFIGSGRASGKFGKRLMLGGQIVFQCVYIFDTSLFSIIWKTTHFFFLLTIFWLYLYKMTAQAPINNKRCATVRETYVVICRSLNVCVINYCNLFSSLFGRIQWFCQLLVTKFSCA